MKNALRPFGKRIAAAFLAQGNDVALLRR